MAPVLGIGLGIAIVLFNLRPVVADVWMRRAHRLADSDTAASVDAAERAVQWWPREAQYLLGLAAISERSARQATDTDGIDLRATEDALHRAITLQPQRFDLWLELGRLYARWPGEPSLEVSERADAAFRQAVDRAPNQAVVYGAWGGHLLDQGNLPGALGMLGKAVDLDATDFLAWTHLGEVQLALGRVPEARYSFENALAVAPRFVPSLLGLAEALWRLGDRDGASAVVERALELAPDDPAAQEFAGRLSNTPEDSSSPP